jgi:hypothetical protein
MLVSVRVMLVLDALRFVKLKKDEVPSFACMGQDCASVSLKPLCRVAASTSGLLGRLGEFDELDVEANVV